MNKIKNTTCCFGDKERCTSYAEEIRAGTITKEGVIVFVLLGIAILLQVFQLYMFRKRWKIGTAPWKRHRMESQNSGRDQDVTGSMPKTDDYKAQKDEIDSAGQTVLKCVTSNAEVQIHTSRSDLKNTKSDNWENNVKALGYCKQKSTETVYSNNSLVPNSQESTPSTKDKIEKVYDYTTSVMVQGLDRASVPNSSAEDIKQPPVLDHRGRTVREKCPTPCRNQKIKIPPNPIQNKLHRPRSQTGSKRKKKIKSKKVENTEYLDWGTCHTKVVKDTRNLNIGCSLPIPRDRGATRSMSLDVTASRSWNISDDDSDTDDSKEEFTPQLTWYIQKLKEKHPYILQRSKTGCMGRKRPCDPRENKTLGSNSSQSLGVMFILDKNKSVSVEDDLEKRSSADYLAIIDTKRHNEQSTILEEREIQSETVSEENLDDGQGQITVIESTLKSDRTSGKEAPTAEVVTYVNEEVVYMTDCNLVHERTGSTVVNMQDSGELLNYTEEKSEMFTIV